MVKPGRNDSCPCGSGKKFKRCCESRGIVLSTKSTPIKSAERILVKTLTEELFQPVRLYYILHDKHKLESYFKKLKCMLYDEDSNDWVINYMEEAVKIGLQIPPNKVPKKAQPLVIATIYIDNENTMLIDVRSIERAEKIITFIDKHIPKTVVEITHAAIYNQLITAGKDEPKSAVDVDYNDIFNQKNITVIDPEKAFREAEEIVAQYKDKAERMKEMIQKTEDDAKKPLPKVEKFPVYYYEDGIEHFKMACRMRQVIAMQHYLGNKDFSFYDLTQQLVLNQENKSHIKGGWVKVT